jgi:RND family efflux transporter MFP subunit
MNKISSSVNRAAEDAQANVWGDFSRSTSDETFVRSWLAVQCELLGDVHAALLLLQDESDGSFMPAAVWPDSKQDLSYLAEAARRSMTAKRGLILQNDGSEETAVVAGDRVHLAMPIDLDGLVTGAVILDVHKRSELELQLAMRQLLWGSGWLHSMLRRRRSGSQQVLVDRAALAVEVLQVAQEGATLDAAAMAVVNELATAFPAARASLGVVRQDRVSVRAISRTAWFDRRSDEVRLLESAMEEAVDQEACLVYPVPEGKEAGRIIVAQRDLAQTSRHASILAIPLKDNRGMMAGAIVLERDSDAPFDRVDADTGELIGELLGPEIWKRLEIERWFAGRAVTEARNFVHRLFGPRHATVKFAGVTALLLLAFLSVATGDFRVSARTVIEGEQQRAAVAPFDGFIAAASVRAGDAVSEGQVLAELDDRDIRLELARWQAEREQAARRYREALAMRDGAASRIHAAQQAQAEAQVNLAEHSLARASMVAPFAGVVVSGDLSQLLGAPVQRGEVLFELAPLGAYRVILEVDDRDISFIENAQQGELVLTGLTGRTIPFTVKTITSVSTAEEGRNFFRVEAQIDDVEDRLRPGMEGIGKIHVDERRLIWIWTRNFVSWLRVSLWTWLP